MKVNRFALKTPGNLSLSGPNGQADIMLRIGIGGEGGIRTHGSCYTTPVFETGAIDHSATSPTPYSRHVTTSSGHFGIKFKPIVLNRTAQ